MKSLIAGLVLFLPGFLEAQELIRWSKDEASWFEFDSKTGDIVRHELPGGAKTVLVQASELTPPTGSKPLAIRYFALSGDESQLLLFTNTVKVWRINSRGDYWVFNLKTKSLKQLGSGKPASSLMFAKFSPDGTRAAYVSGQNLFVEDLSSGKITALTTDGNRKRINGTFDWVYEEELGCRDGFQWSPDSQHIAYWNVDAEQIRDYYMINNTDSAYSRIVPVEYPTMGQDPSPAKIGIADANTAQTVWIPIPGDPRQHYLPRLEWNSASEIFVQQLNRKQNESKIFVYDAGAHSVRQIYAETDDAWVKLFTDFSDARSVDGRHKFVWINSKKEFLWMSEKDGWAHLYRISKDGAHETLITRGDYDVISVAGFDEKQNTVYFIASPSNATQRYLYKTKLDGKGTAILVSPAGQEGTHSYSFSPGCKYANHTFSNNFTKRVTEFIDVRTQKALDVNEGIPAKLASAQVEKKVEFFKIKTKDGVEMDGWMVKPKNFDAAKKYPVVFYVYSEPASQTVTDVFGTGRNREYKGDMSDDGYIYMSVDGRGTPAPKGRAWRKSIFKKIGQINITDQAQAAAEILKWPFVDPDRIAVWGWSGGGTTTLNLMFQYPDIYKTGIAIAAVTNPLTYDNIYQERYYGLPQENLAEIMKGSPLTYAKNLKGNLLYIHGTGDDNVHYDNAEMLINELVKYNKTFQFMAYPNRTHSISEGEGTTEHLSTLYTNYLNTHCPGGPK